MNKLIIKNTVFRKVLENNSLSLRLAEALNIQQVSVLAHARRKSSRLGHYACVKVFEEFGMTEEEIFTSSEEFNNAEESLHEN